MILLNLNDGVESVYMNNKEVESIQIVNGGYIYQKQDDDYLNYPIITLSVTGTSFSSYHDYPFAYDGKVFIDWGDGVIEQYTDGQLNHTFVDSATPHEIIIYGNITSLANYCFMDCSTLTSIKLSNLVTKLGDFCFYRCSSLSSVELSSSITKLGDWCFDSCSSLSLIELLDTVTNLGRGCFNNCLNLNSLVLDWETSNNIITYNSSNTSTGWAYLLPSSTRFSIPLGTTDLYVAKNYPLDRLDERGTPIVQSVTTTLSESSITVEQSVTVTAEITGVGTMIGKTVTFYSNGTSIGTGTITSGNTVSITYTPSSSGSYSITASCDDIDSTAVTLTVNEPEPVVQSVTVLVSPSSITVGQSIPLMATVTGTGSMVGKTVIFKANGNTIGTYTISRSNDLITIMYTPTTSGSYSITASCDNIESAAKTLTVNQSIVTRVDTSVSPSTVYVNNPVTVSATVNGTGTMVGKSVTFKSGTTTIGTATIQSGNTVSITYTPTNVGTESITTSCGGATSIAVTLNVVSVPNSIILTGTKSILSKYDNESCDLIATVYDEDDNPLEDVSVTFTVNDEIVDTVMTNEDGEAEYSYVAEGVGDIEVGAYVTDRILLIQTYSIEDCDGYFVTSQIGNWNNKTQGSDTFKLSDYETPVSNYSIEWKINHLGIQLAVGSQSEWVFAVQSDSSTSTTPNTLYTHTSSGEVSTNRPSVFTANDIIRVEIQSDGTIRFYRNDNLILTKTNCKINYARNLRIYRYNYYSYIDYIKIKAL